MKISYQVIIPESGTANAVADYVDEVTYNKVRTYCESIERFFDNYLGYWIFQSNLESFDNYLTTDHSKLILPIRFSEIEKEVARIQLNRIFLNILSSFRSFIDHAETTIAQLPTHEELLIAFKTAQAKEYDTSDYYRIFWELRNFSQHCSLPIDSYKIDINKSTNGLRFETNLIPIIHCKYLLNHWDKWKPKTKEWLENNREVLVKEMVHNVKNSVLKIQASFLGRDIAIVKEAHDYLTDFKTKLDQAERSVEIWLVQDGKPKEQIFVSYYKMLVAKSFLAEQQLVNI